MASTTGTPITGEYTEFLELARKCNRQVLSIWDFYISCLLFSRVGSITPKMFSSTVFSVLFALLPLVLAQDSGSDSDSYVQGVIDHLRAIGHNEAADVLRRVSDNENGRQWLPQLQDGNYTVFVPDDGASKGSHLPL